MPFALGVVSFAADFEVEWDSELPVFESVVSCTARSLVMGYQISVIQGAMCIG